MSLYFYLPKISSQLIVYTLKKNNFTNVTIEQGSFGLRSVKFNKIAFVRQWNDYKITANLKNIDIAFVPISFNLSSIQNIAIEKAELSLQNNKIFVPMQYFSNLVISPGTEKISFDFNWQSPLDKYWLNFELPKKFAIGKQEITKTKIDGLANPSLHLDYYLGSPLKLLAEVKTPLVLNIGDSNQPKVFEVKSQKIIANANEQGASADITVLLNQKISLNILARYIFATKTSKIHYQFSPVQFSASDINLKRFISAWPYPFDINAGNLHIIGNAQLQLAEKTINIENKSDIELAEASGVFKNYNFSGLNCKCEYLLQKNLHNINCPSIMARNLDLGFPVSNIKANVLIDLFKKFIQIKGQDFYVELIDGNIQIKNLFIDLDPQSVPKPIIVKVEKLDLEKLLKLKQGEEFSATGVLDGDIPVFIDSNGLRVKTGKLHARNAGILRYQPKNAGIADFNPNLKLAIQALSNFHYSQLQSNIDFEPSGKMQLAIALWGKNPDFKAGQPFNFNIGVEENVLTMIRSLSIADKFADAINNRVMENQANKKPQNKTPKNTSH